jgi:acid stress-induced BolA-like protein IbaG/YrbA
VDSRTVEALVRETLEGADVSVEGAGSNYSVRVISGVFEGMRPVKRQQTVYAALNAAIADGSIHAVNIQTFTPDEWEASDA